MKKGQYLLIRNTETNELVYTDYAKGYSFNPKNHEKYEGIQIDKVILVEPDLVEKVLRKKIKKKLKAYLDYMISLLSDDESDESSSELASALDEVSRYKSIIVNSYRKFLEDKYFELLMQKFSLVEHELKVKQLELSKREYAKQLIEKQHLKVEEEKLEKSKSR